MFSGADSLSDCNKALIHASLSASSAWPYDWGSFACSPSPPQPPPPSESADGAVLELTGQAPRIVFGSAAAPVCSLSLDGANGQILSSCELVDESAPGRRRLSRASAPVEAELKALRAEVAELRTALRAATQAS